MSDNKMEAKKVEVEAEVTEELDAVVEPSNEAEVAARKAKFNEDWEVFRKLSYKIGAFKLRFEKSGRSSVDVIIEKDGIPIAYHVVCKSFEKDSVYLKKAKDASRASVMTEVVLLD